MYKILHEKTGLWRNSGTLGGLFGTWAKKGNVWNKLSHIKNHLNQTRRGIARAKPRPVTIGDLGKGRTKEMLAEFERHRENIIQAELTQLEGQYVVEYELVEVRRFPLKDLVG